MMWQAWRTLDSSAMNLSYKNYFLFIAFLLAVVCIPRPVTAQRNLDVCRVTTDTRSLKEGYGTGTYEVGKFPVDSIEDGTEKSFRYETDGRTYSIDVEVEYGDFNDVEKGKPTRIILSLFVHLLNDKTAASMRAPVEAGTSYRHKWGTAYISADVVFGDIAQHFKLICSDGISKNGVQRGEPKWLKKNGTE
jgi:hypothetical protein